MALPNFLIVGAAKSGTTSLYHYLRQHPQVFMPEQIKETLFFCGLTARHFPGPGGHYADRAVETWEAYKQFFGDAGACIARGEACVAYLYFHRASIARILEHLGRAYLKAGRSSDALARLKAALERTEDPKEASRLRETIERVEMDSE